MSWQLQEAKNKLSQVVQQAQQNGPQVISVRGRDAAVVVSAEEYQRLMQRQQGLVSFFQHSPWAEADIDITRAQDTGRIVEL